jgi:UDP-N-acetylmuramate dehydrogenase
VRSLREAIPLAPLTTLGVGGPARFFVEARRADDVREAVDYAGFYDLPLFVLGGGSNLVVSDSGWPGLVLHINIKGITQYTDEERVIFEAGAGESWDAFVAQVVAANYGGVECLSGIPGTVGGTPVQNVGAYGQEVSDTIYKVTAFDRETMQLRTFTSAECEFSYRTSAFNTHLRDRYVVLQVTFALHHNAISRLEYADLKKYFADRQNQPSLQEVRDAVREIRRSKGMLLVEGDPEARSAGSFFKNPIVTAERLIELDADMQARGLLLPSYVVDDHHSKLSAAWLVEKAGFHKGFQSGNVGISTKHTLAIVNRGGATASEVYAFMNVIRDTVRSKFNVELSPEPVFVGFEKAATH